MSVNVWTSAARAISALLLTFAFALLATLLYANEAQAKP
jgi:hypothetical protein